MTIPGSNWEAVTMMINISTRRTRAAVVPKLSEAVQKPKIQVKRDVLTNLYLSEPVTRLLGLPHMAMGRGVFLDLAGTRAEPLKPERLGQIRLIPGVVEAIARFPSAGFICPVVTVQSRIAKRLWSLSEFERWFARFASELRLQGAIVVGPYVCRHRFVEPCICKKPNTLLQDRAASEHRLNPLGSFVIGHSADDMRAAKSLGARGCLVRTGWAADPRVVEEAMPYASIVVALIGRGSRLDLACRMIDVANYSDYVDALIISEMDRPELFPDHALTGRRQYWSRASSEYRGNVNSKYRN